MSDDESATIRLLDGEVVSPEMEMAELGAGVGRAADLTIEEINPANPHLFREDTRQTVGPRRRRSDQDDVQEDGQTVVFLRGDQHQGS